jgi:hypothetical protein
MDKAIITSEDMTTVPNSLETRTLCNNKEVEEDIGINRRITPLKSSCQKRLSLLNSSAS